MREEAIATADESGPLRLYESWPWIHLLIAGAVVAAAAATWPWALENPRWLWFLVLAIPVVALHEWEEFVFPGGFSRWYNTYICRSTNPAYPFTAGQAAASHMPLMVLYPLLAVLGARWPWIGLMGLYALLADAIFHIMATAAIRRYSPGTVTSLLLYVPLGVGATHYFVAAGEVTPTELMLAFFAGVLGLNVFLFLPARKANVAEGTEVEAP